MLHESEVVLMALAGLLVGLVLAFALSRARASEILALGHSQGRSAAQTELREAVEQVRALEAQRVVQGQQRLTLQAQLEPLLREVEEGRIERIRLRERAGRVVSLEAEVARLELQVRMAEEELRRLRASDAKRARMLRGAQEELDRLRRRA